ncbi:MAG: hypothetical protein QM426_04955 [Euryarchaeota archaeon]|nr:hypothetical protein [Euryarchaeota archaeon]
MLLADACSICSRIRLRKYFGYGYFDTGTLGMMHGNLRPGAPYLTYFHQATAN